MRSPSEILSEVLYQKEEYESDKQLDNHRLVLEAMEEYAKEYSASLLKEAAVLLKEAIKHNKHDMGLEVEVHEFLEKFKQQSL